MIHLPPKACMDMLANKPTLCIDIRERYEFEAYNIGWENVPMSETIAYMLRHQIEKDKLILIMCNSGARASAMGNMLEKEYGYTSVVVVEDGIQGWINQMNTQAL